jgi:cold shock CspA family protein
MTTRIQGSVKEISTRKPIFGIILGDDDREYFFMPSSCQFKQTYWCLHPGSRLEFHPFTSDRGLRAEDISVLSTPDAAELSDGERIH